MGPRAQIFWFCVGAGALSLSAAIPSLSNSLETQE